MTTKRTADLVNLGLNASHNKDVLLVAILHETEDLNTRNHWILREKLERLRTLAVTLRDTGRIDHDPRVVGVILDDDDDYQKVDHDPVEED
jgi:hypothetical protein